MNMEQTLKAHREQVAEHKEMEAIAVALDAKADDIWGSNGTITNGMRNEAFAARRCAEIIRHQIECEA